MTLAVLGCCGCKGAGGVQAVGVVCVGPPEVARNTILGKCLGACVSAGNVKDVELLYLPSCLARTSACDGGGWRPVPGGIFANVSSSFDL